MGDGRDRQTRAENGIASQIASGTFDPENVVGKRTLTGDVDAPAGDQYVDRGAYCESHGTADCFLTATYRARLLSEYGGRLDKAESSYKEALTEIKFEKLLQKGSDDLPWFVTLILDVAGMQALDALSSALKFFKARQLSRLAEVVDLDPDGARATSRAAVMAYQGLSQLSDERLSQISRAAVARGSAAAVASLKSELDQRKHDKRASALGYIDKLKHAATVAFEELRKKSLANATDAQLLVLWKAFDPVENDSTVYKSELEAKLKRFETSGVDKIGRDDAWQPLDQYGGAVPIKRDLMVVRVKFKSGSPDRFAYAKKDWTLPLENTLPSERAPEQSLPLDESRWHGQRIPDELRANIRPEFDSFIEPEFVDVAIERHLQIWGTPPEIIEADDSNWTWDKDRVRKASANKVNAPGPFGIPRLQLPCRAEPPVAIPDELRLEDNNS